MSAWSRVTLVGEHRRVDMVLPAREPIGALLPDALSCSTTRCRARRGCGIWRRRPARSWIRG
ncbi:EsaB/YukD family protein [Actinomadura sp. CNU-125]|uniref:EsaB/YukD family protein n=1 Tax=Actinomadura sp. CNU-125 TaxID=1904961 RepID=UPI002916E990|nr:EsaB/YukD family protein [Actinomadura sp. CNU-125]